MALGGGERAEVMTDPPPSAGTALASPDHAVPFDQPRRRPGAAARPSLRPWSARRSFRIWLGLISAVALAIRVIYAVGWQWQFPSHGPFSFSDVYFYRVSAAFAAHGVFFPERVTRADVQKLVQTHVQFSNADVVTWYSGFAHATFEHWPAATHPPLFSLVLAVADLLHIQGYGSQLLVLAAVGTVGVVLVGLIGRKVAGPRVGLLTAAVGALFPGFWLQGSLVMSEPLALVLAAAAILAAYRLAGQPSVGASVVLGVSIGLAALTRSELVLLVPLMAWPTVARLRRVPVRRRLMLAGVLTAACLLVISPWAVRNVLTYHRAELLSTQFGATVADANCAATYSGQAIGYWSGECLPFLASTGNDVDDDTRLLHVGLHYAAAHARRLPLVLLAREGRALDVYAPFQTASANNYDDGWNLTAAKIAVWWTWAVLALAVAGSVMLVRRRVALWPLVGVLLTSVVTVAAFYGDPRFMAASQPALVVAAGCGLDLVGRRLWLLARRRHRAPSPPGVSVAGVSAQVPGVAGRRATL